MKEELLFLSTGNTNCQDYFQYRKVEDGVEKTERQKHVELHETRVVKDCDCSVAKIPGRILLETFFGIGVSNFADLQRVSSVCSARDRLIKSSSLLLVADDKKEKLDKSFTKILLLVTILSIIFLFWIQNSHYHLIENIRSKSSP